MQVAKGDDNNQKMEFIEITTPIKPNIILK